MKLQAFPPTKQALRAMAIRASEWLIAEQDADQVELSLNSCRHMPTTEGPHNFEEGWELDMGSTWCLNDSLSDRMLIAFCWDMGWEDPEAEATPLSLPQRFPNLVNDEALVEALKARVKELGGLRKTARDAGLSPTFISHVLLGRSRPGPKIARYFGYLPLSGYIPFPTNSCAATPLALKQGEGAGGEGSLSGSPLPASRSTGANQP